MNKTVLITGGSGFLGKHLALRLKGEHRVVLAARDRSQLELASRVTGCVTLPADVTHIDSLRAAVAEVAPNVIIHAAGNKVVAVGEKDPLSCIDANVLGAQNIARVAMERDIAHVVGVSSAGAAPPTLSTYGLTKAIMERLFCSLGVRPTGTRFTSVRLGNIAWSTDSVFPAWQRMMSDTGSVGSTGPNDHRFFLSGEDASRAVITALAHIEQLSGKVLVPHIKAARVRDLLDLWVRKHGGAWHEATERRSDRIHDRLIGDLELPYTREATYDGKPYFVISFNEKAPTPLREDVTTANAERFDEGELLKLIATPTTNLL